MRSRIVGLFFLSLLLLTSCGEKIVDITVNPNGGAQFSTIEEAIKEAKAIKLESPKAKVNINLAAGEYYLQSSITLTPEMSGVNIIGEDASNVIIKGSQVLPLKWTKKEGAIYKASVPQGLFFDQVIVNGEAQILARYPNYDESAQYWQGYAADAISKERVASWAKPEGAFFHALHGGRWGGFHYRIAGVNEDGTPILKGGHQNNRPSRNHDEYRMVENVKEELDSPGEWYLDEDNSELYYYPKAGVDMAQAKVEVAVLKDLIQVVGTLDNPVTDVTLSGMTFEHTLRTFMDEFEPLLRSDWTIYRGAVLFFEGAEDCQVLDCEMKNLGGNVIMASKYVKGLVVRGNHIHDCGASAVSFVGDASAVRSPSFTYHKYVNLEDIDTVPGPKNELYPRACTVDDNLIHRIGRTEKQTAGVQISMAMTITVSNNSIYDVPRSGINIGDGTWGGHILEYNDVFNTVLETSDHGSFNSWGRDRFWHPKRQLMNEITTANPEMVLWDAIHTTTIRNNRFRCDHGWDIDLDDGSTNYHIYNNLCLNSGLKLREGFHRVAENNIMVNNSLHPHVWFANCEDIFRHNVIGDTYQDVGLLSWGKEMDYNLFPNEAALAKAQLYDADMHSIIGDPQFKDPKNLDFTVAENSPAMKIGFKNFPMDQFGVKKASLKAMAKTPEVPVMKDPSEVGSKQSSVVAWLRSNIKSVDSEQEQSAYGLNTAEGVILLSLWKGSPAAKGDGLKRGDVILEVEGQKVKTSVEFLKITKKYQEEGVINVKVMRSQAEKALTLKIK